MSPQVIQESSASERDNAFVRFGRSMGRSTNGRLVGALITLVVFTGLAWFTWRHRERAGELAAVYLLLYGVAQAWKTLPFPSGVRARWAENEKIASLHPASRHRSYVLIGIYLALLSFREKGLPAAWNSRDFSIAIFFVCLGLGSWFLCLLHVRKTRRATEKSQANASAI